MKLAGLISEGSGIGNEDAAGVMERNGEIVAAWVLDGVTGINARSFLPGHSDAAWLVKQTVTHLNEIASEDIALPVLLETLVTRLTDDWTRAAASIRFPANYDVPATCLLLAKRYEDGWQALRLGDSILLVEDQTTRSILPPESDLGGLETKLREEAGKRRSIEPAISMKAMLQEFHPQLMASRLARNKDVAHSILVADRSSLNKPEFITLGWPKSMLLCTDGFYRAVDTYGLTDDAGLMVASKARGGVDDILKQIRATEALDPNCERHLRFKPADDATAIALVT